jgi:hypothetical protein
LDFVVLFELKSSDFEEEVENDCSSLRLESIQHELVFERVLGVRWLRLIEEPFDSLISRFDLQLYENIVRIVSETLVAIPSLN